MVKFKVVFDVDRDDLQNFIEQDAEDLGYEYPKDAEETVTFINEGIESLHHLKNYFQNADDNVKIKKIVFEDDDEKKEFEKWLKERRESKDEDEDDDDW